MRTSVEINAELQAVLSRLADVQTQHGAAESEAGEFVRQAALGEAPLGGLLDLNLKAATLGSVVEELQGNRQRLEGDLEATALAEAREASFRQAAEIAKRAEKAWGDYRTAWIKALTEMDFLAGAIADTQETHRDCRLAFNALPERDALLIELNDRGVTTAGIRSVPLQENSFDWSQGWDSREFHGEGWEQLLDRVQRVLVKRNQD
jgi:hypothetical protein